MAFCTKCGKMLNDNANFCPACGAAVNVAPQNEQPQQNAQPNNKSNNDFMSKVADINNTADTTSEFDPSDINQNKVMAVLSYFGILVLIPLLAKKDSKYAQYHAKQGFNVFLLSIAYTIIYSLLHMIEFTRTQYIFGYPIENVKYTPWFVTLICTLIGLAIMVFAVIGIVNAATGKAKELPILGKIKILK